MNDTKQITFIMAEEKEDQEKRSFFYNDLGLFMETHWQVLCFVSCLIFSLKDKDEFFRLSLTSILLIFFALVSKA